MKFQKGQSGNPAGRPVKGNAFAEILRCELDGLVDRKSRRELIAVKVIELAMAGDMVAIRWIVDRTDGPVTERVESTVTTQDISDETIDEVLRYYAAQQNNEIHRHPVDGE